MRDRFVTPESTCAFSLLTAEAVRTCAHRLFKFGRDDKLPHFRIDLDRLDDTADLVLATSRKAYPSLEMPFHSRWRHFAVNGEDRWLSIAKASHWPDNAARARAAFDLAIVSVLLDAGAGSQWRYRDPVTADPIGGSEGLALATLAMFADGAFSVDPRDRLRADAAALRQLSAERLRNGFQVSNSNPLVGIEGRVELLRRLGEVVAANPGIFGRADTPRPGGLFDNFAALSEDRRIVAPAILSELLRQLGPIWPSHLTLGGVPLGDCWRHPAIVTPDATNGLVPLHKLSQWLAYSLIEPLQDAGFTVTDIDGLTGLAEYRNGGLFVDTGVLVLREPQETAREHDVGSTLVVEWRALTVALLDILATVLRRRLNSDASSLPLAKILEGGTWAAGRLAARRLRPDGAPPIRIISDGTVF